MDDLRGLCAPCKVALERLGLPASEAYVSMLLRQYDRDQDGSVTYDDFASYVQKNEAKIWQAFRCAFQHGGLRSYGAPRSGNSRTVAVHDTTLQRWRRTVFAVTAV